MANRYRRSTMRDELARAYAFMARGDMGGSRTVGSPYGRAVYTDEVPKRSDCNYLWVEREANRRSSWPRRNGSSGA